MNDKKNQEMMLRLFGVPEEKWDNPNVWKDFWKKGDFSKVDPSVYPLLPGGVNHGG